MCFLNAFGSMHLTKSHARLAGPCEASWISASFAGPMYLVLGEDEEEESFLLQAR